MTSFSWSKLTAVAAIGLLAALAAAPTGLSLSSGAMKDTIQDPNFESKGCTACHGGGKYTAGGSDLVKVTVKGADGATVSGNTYEKGKSYTITIAFTEQNVPDGGGSNHHAGFNLRASSGKLAGVADISQASTDGTQATHLNAEHTTWDVTWTAPESGPAVFDLFVNDVDASGLPDAGDQVHRTGFYLMDGTGALPGAVAEGEIEYGISLQQYWIGLIGLAGMLFIMVGGYIFLRYGNRHNTDAKDR
ncbi:MAG TPA: choice-of-anchor V domain-containing protein [Candidatus Thermoplasmatota archaeon]|nr:choice-of-anchor V domain-containing protein [Candidatus Thermoplasmatota archaeon]